MEVSGQLHAPATLPPGKEPLGTHWIGRWEGLRADQDVREKRKSVASVGNRTPTVQPVARRYTD
jgi:hypothetical protein